MMVDLFNYVTLFIRYDSLTAQLNTTAWKHDTPSTGRNIVAQQHDSPSFKHKITSRLHDKTIVRLPNIMFLTYFLTKRQNLYMMYPPSSLFDELCAPFTRWGDKNDDLPTNLVTNGQPHQTGSIPPFSMVDNPQSRNTRIAFGSLFQDYPRNNYVEYWGNRVSRNAMW